MNREDMHLLICVGAEVDVSGLAHSFTLFFELQCLSFWGTFPSLPAQSWDL